MSNTKKEKRTSLAELFFTFMKIGAFTFGGGYAMIPLIQREMSEKRDWIDKDDILDMVAIAESTPGPVAVNMATFAGSRLRGTVGAFVATLGEVLPSFVIIAALSSVIQRFEDITAVRYAFFGIRAGVLALIVKALFQMYRSSPKSAFAYVVMGAAFVAVALLNVSVFPVLIGCAAAGLVWSLLIAKKDGKEADA